MDEWEKGFSGRAGCCRPLGPCRRSAFFLFQYSAAGTGRRGMTAVPRRRSQEMEGGIMPEGRARRIKTRSYTTDSSLLRHVQAGEDAAWEDFYRKYSVMINFIGRRRHLTCEECDELKVEVMTVFWRKMDEFIYDRRKGRLRSYLGRIANNCAMQIFTNRRRSNRALAAPEPEYPTGVDEAMMEEWRDVLLKKALETLRQSMDSETYLAFHMSFVQERPVAEIAEVTGKRPTTSTSSVPGASRNSRRSSASTVRWMKRSFCGTPAKTHPISDCRKISRS